MEQYFLNTSLLVQVPLDLQHQETACSNNCTCIDPGISIWEPLEGASKYKVYQHACTTKFYAKLYADVHVYLCARVYVFISIYMYMYT